MTYKEMLHRVVKDHGEGSLPHRWFLYLLERFKTDSSPVFPSESFMEGGNDSFWEHHRALLKLCTPRIPFLDFQAYRDPELKHQIPESELAKILECEAPHREVKMWIAFLPENSSHKMGNKKYGFGACAKSSRNPSRELFRSPNDAP